LYPPKSANGSSGWAGVIGNWTGFGVGSSYYGAASNGVNTGASKLNFASFVFFFLDLRFGF
jgi:hypothetical protein